SQTRVRSSESSRSLRPFMLIVGTAGALVLARAALEASRTPEPLAWMTLAALALVSGWFRLSVKTVSATFGLDDTFCITAALLFGPAPATLALVGHSFVYSVRRRRPARHMTFNAAALALSMWTAARAFFAVTGVAPLAFGH